MLSFPLIAGASIRAAAAACGREQAKPDRIGAALNGVVGLNHFDINWATARHRVNCRGAASFGEAASAALARAGRFAPRKAPDVMVLLGTSLDRPRSRRATKRRFRTCELNSGDVAAYHDCHPLRRRANERRRSSFFIRQSPQPAEPNSNESD
jgi:hypothetical protein